MTRGTETSCKRWRGANVEDVQVGGVPRQERRWGAGETQRCYNEKRLLVGGGSMEEGTENNPETVETGGAGGARISVKHQQRSQGTEGSLSKVETPPTHHLDTSHDLMAGNTHTHMYIIQNINLTFPKSTTDNTGRAMLKNMYQFFVAFSLAYFFGNNIIYTSYEDSWVSVIKLYTHQYPYFSKM